MHPLAVIMPNTAVAAVTALLFALAVLANGGLLVSLCLCWWAPDEFWVALDRTNPAMAEFLWGFALRRGRAPFDDEEEYS